MEVGEWGGDVSFWEEIPRFKKKKKKEAGNNIKLYDCK